MGKSPISYHTEYCFEKPFDRDQKKRSWNIIDEKRNPVNENSQLNKKYILSYKNKMLEEFYNMYLNDKIEKYNNVNGQIKIECINSLNEEWGNTVHYTDSFIKNTWKFPDMMYVLSEGNNFIGCVAIDRHYIIPVISHLFVKKEYRGKKIGPKLLKFAENHCRSVGYKNIYGFCDYSRENYYNKLGFHIIKWNFICTTLTGKTLMFKSI